MGKILLDLVKLHKTISNRFGTWPRVMVDTERIELSISACKAEVIPFNYTPISYLLYHSMPMLIYVTWIIYAKETRYTWHSLSKIAFIVRKNLTHAPRMSRGATENFAIKVVLAFTIEHTKRNPNPMSSALIVTPNSTKMNFSSPSFFAITHELIFYFNPIRISS